MREGKCTNPAQHRTRFPNPLINNTKTTDRFPPKRKARGSNPRVGANRQFAKRISCSRDNLLDFWGDSCFEGKGGLSLLTRGALTYLWKPSAYECNKLLTLRPDPRTFSKRILQQLNFKRFQWQRFFSKT